MSSKFISHGLRSNAICTPNRGFPKVDLEENIFTKKKATSNRT